MEHNSESYIVVKEFTDKGKTTREVIAKGVTKQGFIDAYTEKGCVMRGDENPHFEDIYSGVVYKLENHFEQGGQVDRERDIQIAKTILMQLGGSNRLQIFTGAYNFVAVPNGVSFRIKNRSVNYVKIVLNAMDTYDIEFGRIRGTNYKIVKELSGIYNDQLVEVFNRYTGMVLRLRKGGAIQGEENAEMVMNQNLQIRHHTEELEEILKSGKEVPAWVVSKVSRAADSMSDATHYLEGTLDKMAMGGQVLKEYESIPNTTYQLKIQVYYDKGGMNYFSGGVNKRGYYISVTPVQIERQGNNVVIESYTAFSGIKKLILEVERQSPKSAERAKELAESSIPELKQYVLNQMIEKGQIPQNIPNPEPEPEPDFNIEQLKGEIEALKELLPFLEGDDKKEVEEQIEILNITLMQNDNFGGGVDNNTFVNILLDYGFVEKRGSYGIRHFYNKSKDFYASLDEKQRILDIYKDDDMVVQGRDYNGYSIQSVIDFLNKNGFESGHKYAKGGGVGNFPPKGELKNKENLLLKYEKIGSDYEFFVYKPEKKDVSSYEQIKYVCVNKDCPTRMSYNQFLNYLYAETYLDDRKYANGGGVASIFRKAKNFGKRTLKKGVELGKSAKQKTEDAIRKKKKEIALDILWEVKENLAEGRDEKIALEKSFAVVDDRYEKGGEVFVCPVGTQIQSLIFDKSMFNLRQAKAWAKKNNFENDFVDGKLNTLRIRQKDPAMFTEDGFRTIQLRQGVQAVIGCPKKRTIRRKK